MATFLILEDDPARWEIFKMALLGHDLTIVDTAQAAKDEIAANVYDAIFLDHDLGGETYVSEANENTGSEVARFLAGSTGDILNTPIIIHSMNIPAARGMLSKLQSAGFTDAHQIPFTALVQKYLFEPGFLS
jgi:CheY-like chemotaxis protein